jgi:hypothetical protein
MPTNSAGSNVRVLTATHMATMLFFKFISNKDPVLVEVVERNGSLDFVIDEQECDVCSPKDNCCIFREPSCLHIPD